MPRRSVGTLLDPVAYLTAISRLREAAVQADIVGFRGAIPASGSLYSAYRFSCIWNKSRYYGKRFFIIPKIGKAKYQFKDNSINSFYNAIAKSPTFIL
jgi:hypothetical protein